MSDETNDTNYSRGEMSVLVQQALGMCATCAHTAGEHPDSGPCTASRDDYACGCQEFWLAREQTEDGLQVLSHEVTLSGSLPVPLNRRGPTELWDSMRSGNTVLLLIEASVEGKGFKLARFQGDVIGTIETRKLKAERLVWDDQIDPETGEFIGD